MVLKMEVKPPFTLLVEFDMLDERKGTRTAVVETYDMTNEDARWRLLDDLKESWAQECVIAIGAICDDDDSQASH